ncbi:MAG: 2-phospho-L-lactate guanylyltransferase [Archaeoglobaceae archaeon]|nr:2-phospho-L-lactate guanylyltransferase [Archaeoglobaceae archaeon]MCX8152330.1 2-phospho-L-lactate guanylyltransferase [Archaeoglobaceae archaeon]MDW8013642.1 2-phospho-L-lactate guanylyltransferase [Archaeoglobaceae archaeon]
MKVVVPFKFFNPKSRLSKVLNEEERLKFSLFMLEDVVDVLKNCGCEVKVVSQSNISISAEVVVDRRSLDDVVNDELKDVPKAVVMSDLPLISENVFKRFMNTEGDVVIAPGRKGGTNMLLVRKEGFRVSYHYGSFFKHLKIAEKLGMKVNIFDSFFASCDIDDESDLLELLLHGKGKRSKDYLESLGFRAVMDRTPMIAKLSQLRDVSANERKE